MSEQIVVKSMKDKARDLINIYHDSPENFSNMLKENIANSLDIFKKNFSHRPNNEIKIILHNSNKIEFIDNASGIPVEGTAKMGDGSSEIFNYQAIFEIDGAGSNYGKDIDSAGQHGVFLYTLSMTCEDIEYFISRPNGNVYNIAYHKGDRIKDLNIIEKNHDKNDTYTRIIFSLDNEVWVNPSFTFEEICEIAQPQSSLYNNLTITVEDKINNKTKVFHYDNSLIDYFNEQTSSSNIISDTVHIETVEPYDFKKMGTNIDLHDDIKINLYFNYNNDNEQGFKKEFVNTADLIQYGKIQDGIIDGIKYSINKWLETKGKYNKNEKHITNDDVMSCLNYICDVRCKYVKFAGQIKQSVKENKFKIILSKVIKEQLEIYFIENSLQTDKICTQVLINSRARESADKVRKKSKSKGIIGVTESYILSLASCSSKDVNQCELYLVEGNSAGGTAKQGRNREFQAILPQRGKTENTIKSAIDKKDSECVANIKKALNCGEDKKYDEDKLRYHKVFLFSDADVDGAHIKTLWLSMFYKDMKQLILNNHVYNILPPLFANANKIVKGALEDIDYTYSESEQIEYLKTKKPLRIQRFKGIGEMSNNQVWDTCMNPETRRIQLITIEDCEEANNTVELLMGKNVVNRREFIQENMFNKGDL